MLLQMWIFGLCLCFTDGVCRCVGSGVDLHSVTIVEYKLSLIRVRVEAVVGNAMR